MGRGEQPAPRISPLGRKRREVHLLALEHFQEKCVRFSARKMRKNKELEPDRFTWKRLSRVQVKRESVSTLLI